MTGPRDATAEGPALRLDKWLWQARFFKSRNIAGKVCTSGRLRLNGDIVTKAHTKVRVGDVLTFPKDDHIRVIRVEALGERRGPAAEAQGLFTDLQPPEPANRLPESDADKPPAPKKRPDKRERQRLAALKGGS